LLKKSGVNSIALQQGFQPAVLLDGPVLADAQDNMRSMVRCTEKFKSRCDRPGFLRAIFLASISRHFEISSLAGRTILDSPAPKPVWRGEAKKVLEHDKAF
jgi:hypothetical protein